MNQRPTSSAAHGNAGASNTGAGDDLFMDDSIDLPPAPQAAPTDEGDSSGFDTIRFMYRVSVGVGVAGLLAILLLLLSFSISGCDGADNNNTEVDERDAKRQRADELTARIRQLQADNSGVAAHEALHEIDDIEEEARRDSLGGLRDPIEHARLLISERLGREIQEFYGEIRDESAEARDQEDWRRYAAYADLLEAYLEVSHYRQHAAERMQIDPEAIRNTARTETNNLLRDNLITADIAVARRDFEAAIPHLEKVIRHVWVDEPVLRALESELEQAHIQLMAQQQGEVPGPVPPFSRDDAGIHDAGVSELLPRAERGVRTTVSSIYTRGAELVRDGELDVEVPYFGGTARPIPAEHGLRIQYLIRRPVGDQFIEFTAFTSDMPPDVDFAYLRQIPGLTSAQRVALIVTAINRGLADDAGEMAFELRRDEPDVREELDGVLAEKWGVEVPEGGFPEEDGQVVRPTE
jgi:hypothetical protein